MSEPTYEDISVERLKDMIDTGDIGIFGRRDAETLQSLAKFFDLNHDDRNYKTLKEVIAAWQAISTLGAFGRLLLTVMAATLAAVAAVASITGRWPWLVDLMQGHPAAPK